MYASYSSISSKALAPFSPHVFVTLSRYLFPVIARYHSLAQTGPMMCSGISSLQPAKHRQQMHPPEY